MKTKQISKYQKQNSTNKNYQSYIYDGCYSTVKFFRLIWS